MSEPETMETETVLETPPDKPKRKVHPWMDRTGKASTPRLEAPWQAIRDAVAAGVSMAKVAKRFAEYHPSGHPAMYELIRKRATRESWFVPATAMAKAQQRVEQAGYGEIVPNVSQSAISTPSDHEKVGTLVSQSLSEMGESGSLIAGQLNLRLLRDASRNPERIAPLVDVKDIAVAAKTLRLVAGMDKAAPPVQFNLWGGPGQTQGQTQPARDILNIENWADDE
jgi:hypothetical protein